MDLKSHQQMLLRYLYEESHLVAEESSDLAALKLLSRDHQRVVQKSLEDVFPVFLKTLREGQFPSVMDQFIKVYRPETSSLEESQTAFFNFLSAHDFIRENPMLLDLAKLELRRAQAAIAPAHSALKLEDFIARRDHLESLHLSLQPHVFISQFRHPVYTIWKWALMCDGQDDTACARVPIEEYAESVLTYRFDGELLTQKISSMEAKFLKDFKAGVPLKSMHELRNVLNVEDLFEKLVIHELLIADV